MKFTQIVLLQGILLKYYREFTNKTFSIKNIFLLQQEQFKNGKHNVFTEEINKIGLNSIDTKRMYSVDSIETYAYGTSKDH